MAEHVLHHFNTPDGQSLTFVKCQGLFGSAHRTQGGHTLFHRFKCSEVDRLHRVFLANVTVESPGVLGVVAYFCSSRDSKYKCPAGLR